MHATKGLLKENVERTSYVLSIPSLIIYVMKPRNREKLSEGSYNPFLLDSRNLPGDDHDIISKPTPLKSIRE